MADAVARGTRRRWGLVLLCAGALVLLTLPTLVRNTMGVSVTTVLTGSMRPAIDPGDLVVTSRAQASAIGVGDVIVAQSGQMSFAHRVVDARLLNGLTRLTTKGDANPVIDTDPVMVSPTQSVQRVVWRVPAVGSALAVIASPEAQRLGLSLLIAANLIALALFAARRRPAREAEPATSSDHGAT